MDKNELNSILKGMKIPEIIIKKLLLIKIGCRKNNLMVRKAVYISGISSNEAKGKRDMHI